jgi:hypothetical protein
LGVLLRKKIFSKGHPHNTNLSFHFFSGCDHCEDWFHGDCVNVTEKESKYIKKYFCSECRKKNPNLKVVYKSSFKEHEEKGGTAEKSREKGRGIHKIIFILNPESLCQLLCRTKRSKINFNQSWGVSGSLYFSR